MTTVRAAIYARISSDDGTALGVGRQVADCRALAETKGWHVCETFVDNDVSASSGKTRPEYVRLLAALQEGRADALVVWDIDRLTRTPRELEDVVDLADRHGVALASVGGEVDLATPQGRLTARLKGNVARHEVEQQSRRLKRKFQERAEAGKPHGKVAYGYQRRAVHDDAGQVVGSVELLDEAEAAVIREGARRLLAREPMRRVVVDLNARGVSTPRGGSWDSTMLRQVLLRQRNAGRRVHRGEVIGNGDWPALLDEDTFDRLHAMLTDPARRTTRGNEVKHLLSGIARCGLEDCDGTMRVTNARTHGTRRAPTSYNCRKCNRVRRKKTDVDELVEAVLVARLERPDGPDLLAGDPAGSREAAERVEALQARLDLAADNYAEGSITANQMTRITAKLRPQLDDARARLRLAAPSPDLARFSAGHVREAWETAAIEIKRAVISMLVDVTILPAGSGGRFDPDSVRIDWRN